MPPLDDDAEGRAAARRGERAGVAEREHVRVGREQRRAELRHAGIGVVLRLVDRERFVEGGHARVLVVSRHSHARRDAVQRPAQVHGRRACRAQLPRRFLDGSGHAGLRRRGHDGERVCGGHADGRRAAHAHRRDRLGGGVDGIEGDVAGLAGEQRLVEQPQPPVAPGDRFVRLAGSGCGSRCPCHAPMVERARRDGSSPRWRACVDRRRNPNLASDDAGFRPRPVRADRALLRPRPRGLRRRPRALP